MKIKRLMTGYSTRAALITLENDAERALTNDQLMLIVDNARGIEYLPEANSYRLTGHDFGPDRGFGGRVEKTPAPDVMLVSVNID